MVGGLKTLISLRLISGTQRGRQCHPSGVEGGVAGLECWSGWGRPAGTWSNEFDHATQISSASHGHPACNL